MTRRTKKNTENPYVLPSEEHVQNTSYSTFHTSKKKEKRNETQLSSVGQVGSYMDYVFILCPLANALHTATAKSFIVIRPLVIAVLSNTFAG